MEFVWDSSWQDQMRGVRVGIDIENRIITDEEAHVNLQVFMNLDVRLTSPRKKSVPRMSDGFPENPESLCKMIMNPAHQPGP